jgi:hypothetical protein
VLLVAMTPSMPLLRTRFVHATSAGSSRLGASLTSSGTQRLLRLSRRARLSSSALRIGARRSTSCNSRRPAVFGEETLMAT